MPKPTPARDKTRPLELDVLENGEHEVIGQTRLWGHKIEVCLTEHAGLKEFDAFCIWFKGSLTICIAARLKKDKRRFANILCHELTHAIEYLNDPAFLSPKMTKYGCTELAQVMETAWPEILRNLSLAYGLSLTGQSPKKRPRS